MERRTDPEYSSCISGVRTVGLMGGSSLLGMVFLYPSLPPQCEWLSSPWCDVWLHNRHIVMEQAGHRATPQYHDSVSCSPGFLLQWQKKKRSIWLIQFHRCAVDPTAFLLSSCTCHPFSLCPLSCLFWPKSQYSPSAPMMSFHASRSPPI